MTRRPLTGSRCECPECLEVFSSERAFDRHRIGPFAGPGEFRNGRRCLTRDEMTQAGWSVAEAGCWLQPLARHAQDGEEGPYLEGGATPVAGEGSDGPNRRDTHVGRKPEGA